MLDTHRLPTKDSTAPLESAAQHIQMLNLQVSPPAYTVFRNLPQLSSYLRLKSFWHLLFSMYTACSSLAEMDLFVVNSKKQILSIKALSTLMFKPL